MSPKVKPRGHINGKHKI